LTKVYPYRDLPRKCKNCLSYGHSAKQCKSTEPNCAHCAKQHATESCTLEAGEQKTCYNCKGNHSSGHTSCPVKKKEEDLLSIQKNMKVNRTHAEDIMNGKADQLTESTEYARYVQVNLDYEQRRKLCPFKVEKFFKTRGIVRENIRSERRCIIIKTVNEKQTEATLALKQICDIPCVCTLHNIYNRSKGIIYINEFKKSDDSFEEEFKRRFNACSIEEAKWIPRRFNRVAYVVEFDDPSIPASIQIPGEQRRTKVFECMPRPLFCVQCLQYSHKKKFCKNTARCAKCTSEQHTEENCSSTNSKCLNCKEQHRTNDQICKRRRQEEEILIIKHRKKVNWNEAKQQYFSLHPNEEDSYAEMANFEYRNKTLTPQSDDHSQMPRPQQTQPTPASVMRKAALTQQTPTPAPQPVVIGARPKVRRFGELSSDDEPDIRKKKKGKVNGQTVQTLDASMDSDSDTSIETNDKIRREVERIYNEYKPPEQS